MLKTLVRVSVVFITLFISLVAGLYVTVAQGAFPQGTQYSIGLSFTQARLSKAAAIAGLDTIANDTGAYLAKVAPDPTKFYSVKNLYVFGRDAPSHDRPANWFTPGLSGSIKPASELGVGSLDGPYVLSDSARAVSALKAWSHSNGIRAQVTERSGVQLLEVALVTTGAWLALVTGLVLLISVVITWYVTRARARTLRVLAGQRRATIFLGDLVSFVLVTVPPIACTLAAAAVIVGVARGTVNLFVFLAAAVPFVLATFVALLVCASIVGLVCLPHVDRIASRTPAERPFRLVSELVRVTAIVLTLVFLPTVGTAAATAFNSSRTEARWAPLAQDVSVRIAPRSQAGGTPDFSGFGSLAKAAENRKSLRFSYDLHNFLPPGGTAGLDGIVLTNPSYLQVMGGEMGVHPSQGKPLGRAGQQVKVSQLPPSIKEPLLASFSLWTSGTTNRLPADGSVRIFRYSSNHPFPVVDPNGNDLRFLSNPLVIVVDKPGFVFDSQFLGAVMSTSNILFSDPVWLNHYLATHSVGKKISFVDRVSDVALNKSQTAMQQAIVLTAAMVIVLLALLMSTVIATRIHALVHAKRIFTLRINGRSWGRILRTRVLIELIVTAVLTVIAFASIAAVGADAAGWILLAFPVYGATIVLSHARAARAVFATVARRRS